MAIIRIIPAEASSFIEQGYRYLDVRSVPEYETGHPAGAENIPLLNFVPSRGMVPNQEFLNCCCARFDKQDKIIVGCKSGGRSLRAAEILLENGFTNVVDMRGGYEGEYDMLGQLAVTGWRDCGLPIEVASPRRDGF